jgi:hypothetical protein
MKALFKLVGILAIIVFILGCFITVFYAFFLMPDELLKVLNWFDRPSFLRW